MYQAFTDIETSLGCPFGQRDCDTCIMIDDCFLCQTGIDDFTIDVKGNVTLKNNIKKYRKKYGYTQQQLADLIGTSKNTISVIESEKHGCSAYTAAKLCMALGCKFEDLFILDFNIKCDEFLCV